MCQPVGPDLGHTVFKGYQQTNRNSNALAFVTQYLKDNVKNL